MSKQTAVDLFHDRIMELLRGAKSVNSNTVAIIWLECKAMEREQHGDTWLDSRVELPGFGLINKPKSFEEYFNETYGKEAGNAN